MSLRSPQPHARIRCREIREADFPAVADLLGRSFARRELQLSRLRRLAERGVPPGMPNIGYLLECSGTPVGAILTIFATVAWRGTSCIRCNLSSWHVEPDYRSYAPLLIAQALKHKDVTYVNVSARPGTWPIVEAQGFSRYSKGVFLALPALSRRGDGARIAPIATAEDTVGGIDPREGALLRDHATFGCTSILCRAADGVYPFVFARRDLKRFFPAVQLVYCRRIEDFVRFAGQLGRHLAVRGVACVLVDANGPIPGLRGRYVDGKMPKFFRGNHIPRQGDLAYTNLALFANL
jgi:hypothetical protein